MTADGIFGNGRHIVAVVRLRDSERNFLEDEARAVGEIAVILFAGILTKKRAVVVKVGQASADYSVRISLGYGDSESMKAIALHCNLVYARRYRADCGH